jgi:hypothetical protein
MAKIEIEESDLRALRGASELLEKMQSSPKARRTFQRALKEVAPDYVTDEDRLKEAPEVQKLDALEARLDKFLTAQETREQDSEREQAFARLRQTAGLQPEGEEKIKQLMVDRKIADPEAAFALWERQHPPAPLPKSGLFTSTSFGIGHKTDDADTKLLFEDEDAYAEREFFKVMNETAQG